MEIERGIERKRSIMWQPGATADDFGEQGSPAQTMEDCFRSVLPKKAYCFRECNSGMFMMKSWNN